MAYVQATAELAMQVVLNIGFALQPFAKCNLHAAGHQVDLVLFTQARQHNLQVQLPHA